MIVILYNVSDLNLGDNVKSVDDLDIKISVIVPCYNVQKYIVRCVDSLINQSIGYEKIEIILVNDASTDETYQVLLDIEKRYPEQMLIINCEENGKQGRARNIGLSYASGDFITFVDADDLIDPLMLEWLASGMVNYQTQIAECTFQTFKDEKEIRYTSNKDKEGLEQLVLVEDAEEANIFFINNAFETSACRRLYRRDFIQEAQLYFPENIFMEDIFFTQLAMVYCKSVYKVNKPLYYYFQNETSTMHSEKIKNYYLDVHYVSAMVIEEMKKRGFFDSYKSALEFVYKRKVLEDLTAYMQQNFEIFPDENYQIMREYVQNTFDNNNRH